MKAEKKTRSTIPKAIAAASKSCDKSNAIDIAVFNRNQNRLTELARELYQLCRVQHPKLKKVAIDAMSSGGERHDWDPPRRQSIRQRTQSFERWTKYKIKELLVWIDTGDVWYGKNFLADLEREFERVCKTDATALLFNAPANTKSKSNNPNWFRQILIANSMLTKPFPLLQIAKHIDMPVRNLRREARKLGAKPGKAGTPKRGKAPRLI